MSIDFDSFFRNRIEGLLIRASWVEGLRSMVGLRSVSQVWKGCAAWYFWLQQAPGVYHLVFSEGDMDGSGNHRVFEGHFALKCYPFSDQPCFSGFSAQERRLTQSEFFDSTHTPRFESEEHIPHSLFTVGSISLLCHEDENLALLSYQSLDALRIYHIGGAPGVEKPNHERAAANLVRNVAGWSIGFPFFECLVGLYAHVAGRPPAFVGATSSPGFEYAICSDGRAECRSSHRTTQSVLSIGFGLPGGDTDRIETLWQSRLEPSEQIQIARRLPESVCDARGLDLPANFAINPLWWVVADSDFQTKLDSICGCNSSDCSHSAIPGNHEH